MSVVANVAINIDAKNAQSTLAAIEAKVKELNGSFDETTSKTNNFGANIKAAAADAVQQLASVGAAAFAVSKAIQTIAGQQQAEAALSTLGVNAVEARQSLSLLSTELSGQASTLELTKAAYDVASSGFAGVTEQTNILSAATKGAVGGMSDVNTVANAVTSVLNTYGMSADKAGKLVDGFIQTQNDGKIVLNEYAHYIGQLAPTAAAAGVGIDELNAAVAAATAVGVPVESTITGLNQALVAILKPTQEAATLAKELGINFNEGGLKALGFGGLLEQVAQKTNGSTEKMVKLFGSVDALKAILPLTGDNLARFNKYLENQKNSAGESDRAFNKMKETLNGAFKGVMTSIENLIGRLAVFAPLVVKPMTLLAQAIDLVSKNLKTVVGVSAFAAGFAAALNATAIAAALVTLRIQAMAIATKVAVVAQTALMALTGPAGWAAIAAGAAAAVIATTAMGTAMDNAAKESTKTKDETAKINAEAEKLKASMTAALQQTDQLPSAFAKANASAQSYTTTLNNAKLALEGGLAALERGNAINQARYGAEQALNTLKGAQLEREMSLATTAQQRADIAVKMFQQQIQAAQIEYNMALEAIKLDQAKQRLAIGLLDIKYKTIEAAAKEKIMLEDDINKKAKIKADMLDALSSQREAIKLAQQNLDATKQTAAYQEQTAKAVYNTKVVQAQMTLESKLTSNNIGMSQQNAVSLSNSLASGVGQARGLASAMSQVAANANNAASAMQRALAYQNQMQNVPVSSTSTATSKSATYSNGGFYDINVVNSAASRAQAEMNAAANPEPSRIVAYYAKGGYVSKATNAIIGEKGPEYVVPARKAASFASNYLSGMRGDSAVQSKTASSAASYLASPRGSGGSGGKAPSISIQTGPVTQMNGVNYVTTQEMARAVQTGVRQTLNMLRNDGSARQVVGMS